MAPEYNFGMRVSRKDILPLAETAIRKALREAVREAILDVAGGAGARVRPEKPGVPGTASAPTGYEDVFDPILPDVLSRRPRVSFPGSRVPFGDLSDEEAWEQFDSIRFARYAGGAR
jgi:hypothetical protein